MSSTSTGRSDAGAQALILGIESSCDDTAAAVVRGGVEILSSVVRTQAAEHSPFGGVVPEIAGRSHLRSILPAVDQALDDAGVRLEEIDAIAVTARPGLIGSLLVGLCTAKSLAWTRGLPLVAVHHIEAHAYAAAMEHAFDYPVLALIVSGGHTALYRMASETSLEKLAETRDDAAGEAFDKVANLLGLGYPGGPEVSRLAATGRADAIRFPRYRPKEGGPGFSFSGLKTSVLYHLRGQDARNPTPPPEEIENPADVAASFEEALVETLVTQTIETAEAQELPTIVVSGGVACNGRLRERMTAAAEARGLRAVFPSPAYCTDNAAMIAGLGFHRWRAGLTATLDLDAQAR